jgi:hypothetical protein
MVDPVLAHSDETQRRTTFRRLGLRMLVMNDGARRAVAAVRKALFAGACTVTTSVSGPLHVRLPRKRVRSFTHIGLKAS